MFQWTHFSWIKTCLSMPVCVSVVWLNWIVIMVTTLETTDVSLWAKNLPNWEYFQVEKFTIRAKKNILKFLMVSYFFSPNCGKLHSISILNKEDALSSVFWGIKLVSLDFLCSMGLVTKMKKNVISKNGNYLHVLYKYHIPI